MKVEGEKIEVMGSTRAGASQKSAQAFGPVVSEHLLAPATAAQVTEAVDLWRARGESYNPLSSELPELLLVRASPPPLAKGFRGLY